MFSVRTAKEITQVQATPNADIRGLSGSVKRVYETQKTGLHFANMLQYAENDTALDLDGISNRVGTELSGVLGVTNFRTLRITIDYRDGLVAFDF